MTNTEKIESIKQKWVKEIYTNKNELDQVKKELQNKKNNTGITLSESNSLGKKINILERRKIILLGNGQDYVFPLMIAINKAKDVPQRELSSINDAVIFLEKYSDFLLKNKDQVILIPKSENSSNEKWHGFNRKNIVPSNSLLPYSLKDLAALGANFDGRLTEEQLEDLSELITQGSDVLIKLTKDIKAFRTDHNIAKRALSALQGLGLCIAGILTSALIVAISPLAITPCAWECWNSLLPRAEKYFINAFKYFKETWTGKVEPPELTNLKKEVDYIQKQFSSEKGVSQNSIFAKKKDSSPPEEQNLNENPKLDT